MASLGNVPAFSVPHVQRFWTERCSVDKMIGSGVSNTWRRSNPCAWFYNHGLCLDFTSKNHDTLKWTKCTENKTAELWEQTGNHTITWIETTQCIGVSGTTLKITPSSSCDTKKPYQWTKVPETSIGLASAPGQPAVTPGNASAAVSWSAPATPGAFPILRYTVTASPGGGFCLTTGALNCTVRTLTPGTPYTFTVTPWGIGGTGTTSPASTVAVLTAYPSAPAKPIANPGIQSATLSWPAAATNGTAITAYTATSSPGTMTCSPATLSTPSCTVGTLTNGTSYTFTVKAHNGLGTSLASPVSTPATPGTPTIPGKPTATRGNKSVTLSWSTSSTNSSAITAYTVTSTPGAKTCAPTTLSTPSCTVATLTNGTPYFFTVKAKNAVGTSPASAASTLIVPAAVPTAPAKPTVVNGNKTVTVSWTAPATNGTTITSYTVTSSPGAKTCSPASLATLKCAIGTLTNGTPYSFSVVAHNGVGTSLPSPSTTVVTPGAPTAPGKPTAVSGNKTATVSWTAPATTNGTAITGYTVTSAPTAKTCSWTTGPLTCSVGTLKNGTSYTFTVKAHNGVGTSVASAASTALSVGSPPAPGRPTAVSGTKKATVSWTAPPTTNGSPITKYKVTSSGSSAKTCTTTGALTCTVKTLKDGTSYTFTVKATNANGTSPASVASTAIVDGAPAAPAKPVATRGNKSAAVTWTAPATEGHAITAYTVTASPGGKTCTWSTGPLTCTVKTLTNGTSYTFTVKAKNAEGTSPASLASTAVTPATVPSAPAKPTATHGNKSATVSWSAPTNGGTAITHYKVTASPGTKGCGPASLSTLSCTVMTLTNGVSYTFTVVAHNGVGTSTASTPSNQVIPAAVPTLSTVTPTTGSVTGGTVVTLTGTGFLTGETSVTFGSGNLGTTVHVAGTTSLTVKAPSHSPGIVTVTVTTPGGVTAAQPYTYDPVPTLSTVTPAAGKVAGGTAVTLSGSGFRTGATSVTFGAGNHGATVHVSGTTTLTVKAPSHSAGTVTVTVSTPGGTSGTKHYAYDPIVTLSTVTPSAGKLSGGTAVTLTGTGFVTGATSVKFGATTARSWTVTSSTTIVAVTEAHSAGTVTVTVTTPGGTSDTEPYTYDPIPSLSTVTPAAGKLGGTVITLTGSGFRTGATSVTFGAGNHGTTVHVTGTTSLTVKTPSHSAGTVTVTVSTPGGSSGAKPYTYDPGPTLSKVTPSAGKLGGTVITLTGSGFRTGATSVTFGAGNHGTTVHVTGTTSLTVKTPSHSAGTVTVTVSTPGGSSGAKPYTYNPGPTLYKVTPSAGKLVGGTLVTLTGSGFRTGATSVTFGSGNHGATVHVSGTTSLTVKTPAHSAGTVTVTVTTPGGSSGAKPYGYDPIPTIASLSRTSGPTSGGTQVTVTGTGLSSVTSVKFGTTTAASFTIRSATQLVTTSPVHAAGTVRISATSPGGTTPATPADTYKFTVSAPVVSAISPASGPAAGGTSVTVSGSGFSGATTVLFGTAKGKTVAVNAGGTQLTVKSPAGSSGASVNVRVVTPGNESPAVTADLFTYGPTITSLSRTSGPVAGGTKVTIAGSGFSTVLNVKFGTTTAKAFTVSSSTSIIATSPAHAAGQVRISVTTAAGTTPATSVDLYTF